VFAEFRAAFDQIKLVKVLINAKNSAPYSWLQNIFRQVLISRRTIIAAPHKVENTLRR
jgi:hypothetical protein